MDDSAAGAGAGAGAAASTTSSRIYLDLNVNLLPKLEPKQEPLDDSYSPLPLPLPHSSSSEEDTKPLQYLSPKFQDEDSLFSEYYRLAHLFLSLTSTSTSPSLSPSPPLPPPSEPSKSIVPAPPPSSPHTLVPAAPRRRHRPRSAEMVRVSVPGAADQRHFRELVRRTRSTFESLRLLLSLHEDSCCSASPPGRRCRPDLKSAALMTAHGLWINRDRRIVGPIPGVLVGDVFFFRIELCVVGLHGQVQGGIDYVPASRAPTREPIATSIVVSGGYEDDEDSGNVIIYTGHGGRDHNAHKHSLDQRLDGGNLALERSMAYGVEIRVIRGFRFDGGPAGKVYVYDGLYRVVDFWKDVGKSGFTVYKYRIVRMAGQFEMGSVVLRFAEAMKDRLTSTSPPPPGYITHDISSGKEHIPIGLFNNIDDDREPMLFDYVACPVYPHSLLLRCDIGGGGGGCRCVANCSPENGCSCASRNGGDFPYDAKGVLIMGKPLIYECSSFCSCPPSCRNRVSQKGVRSRLEVFRSRETGWGVRSLDLIRAGSFVCEYSGIVLTEQQTELLSMNGDALVHPKRFPNRWFEWGDVSNVDPGYQRPTVPSLPNVKFSLDVSRSRNVACYLSHSCSPNVFPQLVLYDHYDECYPHLVIFAMENIPPYRELSIDYGIGDGWMVNVDP